MRTAVIVAGVCRFTEIASKSWDIFPEADWYLSTWNISQQPYSPDATSSKLEIKAIAELFTDILISDYHTEFLNQDTHMYKRSFILLEKALERIKHQGYERVIYFRPDLMLYTLDDFSTDDFMVSDSEIKILDSHEPDFWVDHTRRSLQDSFFVFSWQSFNKFVYHGKDINLHSDIHQSLYRYLEIYQLNVTPLYNMRSVILRDQVYLNMSDLSWQNLTSVFVDTYRRNQHNYHQKYARDIKFTHQPADPELIRISQAAGGILKRRS
jgi:hypothetical protein